MIGFEKVGYGDVVELRKKYLDSLYESQELFMEMQVAAGDYYVIQVGETVGYFIISSQKIMVEFYLDRKMLMDCEEIFLQICETFNIEKVYCKSFDSVLLKCCLKHFEKHTVIGTLFRDFTKTEPDAMEGFDVRVATENDIPFLLQQKDGLYESEEELFYMARNDKIHMYFQNGNLVGCGYLWRIIEDRNYYDIGMWVNPGYRKMGFATRIIANLKGNCLKNGRIPVCGCAVDNLASRKTLEKNGFISKHDLIEFSIK
ncbi:MAG: GNAT family N-acetyltransferase [Clostridia bacterium]|nr:GNAT family N-acetyltransferase [Clostridia bacterium]